MLIILIISCAFGVAGQELSLLDPGMVEDEFCSPLSLSVPVPSNPIVLVG